MWASVTHVVETVRKWLTPPERKRPRSSAGRGVAGVYTRTTGALGRAGERVGEGGWKVLNVFGAGGVGEKVWQIVAGVVRKVLGEGWGKALISGKKRKTFTQGGKKVVRLGKMMQVGTHSGVSPRQRRISKRNALVAAKRDVRVPIGSIDAIVGSQVNPDQVRRKQSGNTTEPVARVDAAQVREGDSGGVGTVDVGEDINETVQLGVDPAVESVDNGIAASTAWGTGNGTEWTGNSAKREKTEVVTTGRRRVERFEEKKKSGEYEPKEGVWGMFRRGATVLAVAGGVAGSVAMLPGVVTGVAVFVAGGAVLSGGRKKSERKTNGGQVKMMEEEGLMEVGAYEVGIRQPAVLDIWGVGWVLQWLDELVWRVERSVGSRVEGWKVLDGVRGKML